MNRLWQSGCWQHRLLGVRRHEFVVGFKTLPIPLDFILFDRHEVVVVHFRLQTDSKRGRLFSVNRSSSDGLLDRLGVAEVGQFTRKFIQGWRISLDARCHRRGAARRGGGGGHAGFPAVQKHRVTSFHA
jgi:hypothetical protein